VAKHFIKRFFTKPDMELFDDLPEGKHLFYQIGRLSSYKRYAGGKTLLF